MPVFTKQKFYLLASVDKKEGDLIHLLSDLYQYIEKGYYFLAESPILGNFNEMGKSFLITAKNKDKNILWDLINKEDKFFYSTIKEMISRIENQSIILSGKKKTGHYGQSLFEYIDKNK